MILLYSLQQVFACVDIEFYHLMPGNCYSASAPLGTQTRWPPSFYFTEISSISAFHSSNSLFHSAEMSSIPTLNSPPLLVILSFSLFLLGQTPAYDSQVAGKWKPGSEPWRAPPPRAGARSHLRGKTIKTSLGPTSGAVSYRASLPFFLLSRIFHLFLPPVLQSPTRTASSTARSKNPPHLSVQLACMCVSVCFLEPGAGSSCVQRGQYTSWQSVIIPEGGVGGLHNAGWHLRKFKAAECWRGAAVAVGSFS